MSNDRIKLPTTKITRARAEELLGELATLKLQEREEKNALDRDLTAAREAYEAPLLRLAKQIEEKTTILESWAAANPEEFPKNRKSIEMIHGILGYRTGTPKLKTLPKWTWDRVLEKLREMLPEFVRTKEEVNKEGLIAAVGEGRLDPTEARQLGVQVVQDEAFFVEPRLSEQPARSEAVPA
jgi:phage host-nuclease inhibitor protein Gam